MADDTKTRSTNSKEGNKTQNDSPLNVRLGKSHPKNNSERVQNHKGNNLEHLSNSSKYSSIKTKIREPITPEGDVPCIPPRNIKPEYKGDVSSSPKAKTPKLSCSDLSFKSLLAKHASLLEKEPKLGSISSPSFYSSAIPQNTKDNFTKKNTPQKKLYKAGHVTQQKTENSSLKTELQNSKKPQTNKQRVPKQIQSSYSQYIKKTKIIKKDEKLSFKPSRSKDSIDSKQSQKIPDPQGQRSKTKSKHLLKEKHSSISPKIIYENKSGSQLMEHLPEPRIRDNSLHMYELASKQPPGKKIIESSIKHTNVTRKTKDLVYWDVAVDKQSTTLDNSDLTKKHHLLDHLEKPEMNEKMLDVSITSPEQTQKKDIEQPLKSYPCEIIMTNKFVYCKDTRKKEDGSLVDIPKFYTNHLIDQLSNPEEKHKTVNVTKTSEQSIKNCIAQTLKPWPSEIITTKEMVYCRGKVIDANSTVDTAKLLVKLKKVSEKQRRIKEFLKFQTTKQIPKDEVKITIPDKGKKGMSDAYLTTSAGTFPLESVKSECLVNDTKMSKHRDEPLNLTHLYASKSNIRSAKSLCNISQYHTNEPLSKNKSLKLAESKHTDSPKDEGDPKQEPKQSESKPLISQKKVSDLTDKGDEEIVKPVDSKYSTLHNESKQVFKADNTNKKDAKVDTIEVKSSATSQEKKHTSLVELKKSETLPKKMNNNLNKAIAEPIKDEDRMIAERVSSKHALKQVLKVNVEVFANKESTTPTKQPNKHSKSEITEHKKVTDHKESMETQNFTERMSQSENRNKDGFVQSSSKEQMKTDADNKNTRKVTMENKNEIKSQEPKTLYDLKSVNSSTNNISGKSTKPVTSNQPTHEIIKPEVLTDIKHSLKQDKSNDNMIRNITPKESLEEGIQKFTSDMKQSGSSSSPTDQIPIKEDWKSNKEPVNEENKKFTSDIKQPGSSSSLTHQIPIKEDWKSNKEPVNEENKKFTSYIKQPESSSSLTHQIPIKEDWKSSKEPVKEENKKFTSDIKHPGSSSSPTHQIPIKEHPKSIKEPVNLENKKFTSDIKQPGYSSSPTHRIPIKDDRKSIKEPVSPENKKAPVKEPPKPGSSKKIVNKKKQGEVRPSASGSVKYTGPHKKKTIRPLGLYEVSQEFIETEYEEPESKAKLGDNRFSGVDSVTSVNKLKGTIKIEHCIPLNQHPNIKEIKRLDDSLIEDANITDKPYKKNLNVLNTINTSVVTETINDKKNAPQKKLLNEPVNNKMVETPLKLKVPNANTATGSESHKAPNAVDNTVMQTVITRNEDKRSETKLKLTGIKGLTAVNTKKTTISSHRVPKLSDQNQKYTSKLIDIKPSTKISNHISKEEIKDYMRKDWVQPSNKIAKLKETTTVKNMYIPLNSKAVKKPFKPRDPQSHDTLALVPRFTNKETGKVGIRKDIGSGVVNPKETNTLKEATMKQELKADADNKTLSDNLMQETTTKPQTVNAVNQPLETEHLQTSANVKQVTGMSNTNTTQEIHEAKQAQTTVDQHKEPGPVNESNHSNLIVSKPRIVTTETLDKINHTPDTSKVLSKQIEYESKIRDDEETATIEKRSIEGLKPKSEALNKDTEVIKVNPHYSETELMQSQRKESTVETNNLTDKIQTKPTDLVQKQTKGDDEQPSMRKTYTIKEIASAVTLAVKKSADRTNDTDAVHLQEECVQESTSPDTSKSMEGMKTDHAKQHEQYVSKGTSQDTNTIIAGKSKEIIDSKLDEIKPINLQDTSKLRIESTAHNIHSDTVSQLENTTREVSTAETSDETTKTKEFIKENAIIVESDIDQTDKELHLKDAGKAILPKDMKPVTIKDPTQLKETLPEDIRRNTSAIVKPDNTGYPNLKTTKLEETKDIKDGSKREQLKPSNTTIEPESVQYSMKMEQSKEVIPVVKKSTGTEIFQETTKLPLEPKTQEKTSFTEQTPEETLKDLDRTTTTEGDDMKISQLSKKASNIDVTETQINKSSSIVDVDRSKTTVKLEHPNTVCNSTAIENEGDSVKQQMKPKIEDKGLITANESHDNLKIVGYKASASKSQDTEPINVQEQSYLVPESKKITALDTSQSTNTENVETQTTKPVYMHETLNDAKAQDVSRTKPNKSPENANADNAPRKISEQQQEDIRKPKTLYYIIRPKLPVDKLKVNDPKLVKLVSKSITDIPINKENITTVYAKKPDTTIAQDAGTRSQEGLNVRKSQETSNIKPNQPQEDIKDTRLHENKLETTKLIKAQENWISPPTKSEAVDRRKPYQSIKTDDVKHQSTTNKNVQQLKYESKGQNISTKEGNRFQESTKVEKPEKFEGKPNDKKLVSMEETNPKIELESQMDNYKMPTTISSQSTHTLSDKDDASVHSNTLIPEEVIKLVTSNKAKIKSIEIMQENVRKNTKVKVYTEVPPIHSKPPVNEEPNTWFKESLKSKTNNTAISDVSNHRINKVPITSEDVKAIKDSTDTEQKRAQSLRTDVVQQPSTHNDVDNAQSSHDTLKIKYGNISAIPPYDKEAIKIQKKELKINFVKTDSNKFVDAANIETSMNAKHSEVKDEPTNIQEKATLGSDPKRTGKVIHTIPSTETTPKDNGQTQATKPDDLHHNMSIAKMQDLDKTKSDRSQETVSILHRKQTTKYPIGIEQQNTSTTQVFPVDQSTNIEDPTFKESVQENHLQQSENKTKIQLDSDVNNKCSAVLNKDEKQAESRLLQEPKFTPSAVNELATEDDKKIAVTTKPTLYHNGPKPQAVGIVKAKPLSDFLEEAKKAESKVEGTVQNENIKSVCTKLTNATGDLQQQPHKHKSKEAIIDKENGVQESIKGALSEKHKQTGDTKIINTQDSISKAQQIESQIDESTISSHLTDQVAAKVKDSRNIINIVKTGATTIPLNNNEQEATRNKQQETVHDDVISNISGEVKPQSYSVHKVTKPEDQVKQPTKRSTKIKQLRTVNSAKEAEVEQKAVKQLPKPQGEHAVQRHVSVGNFVAGDSKEGSKPDKPEAVQLNKPYVNIVSVKTQISTKSATDVDPNKLKETVKEYSKRLNDEPTPIKGIQETVKYSSAAKSNISQDNLKKSLKNKSMETITEQADKDLNEAASIQQENTILETEFINNPTAVEQKLKETVKEVCLQHTSKTKPQDMTKINRNSVVLPIENKQATVEFLKVRRKSSKIVPPAIKTASAVHKNSKYFEPLKHSKTVIVSDTDVTPKDKSINNVEQSHNDSKEDEHILKVNKLIDEKLYKSKLKSLNNQSNNAVNKSKEKYTEDHLKVVSPYLLTEQFQDTIKPLLRPNTYDSSTRKNQGHEQTAKSEVSKRGGKHVICKDESVKQHEPYITGRSQSASQVPCLTDVMIQHSRSTHQGTKSKPMQISIKKDPMQLVKRTGSKLIKLIFSTRSSSWFTNEHVKKTTSNQSAEELKPNTVRSSIIEKLMHSVDKEPMVDLALESRGNSNIDSKTPPSGTVLPLKKTTIKYVDLNPKYNTKDKILKSNSINSPLSLTPLKQTTITYSVENPKYDFKDNVKIENQKLRIDKISKTDSVPLSSNVALKKSEIPYSEKHPKYIIRDVTVEKQNVKLQNVLNNESKELPNIPVKKLPNIPVKKSRLIFVEKIPKYDCKENSTIKTLPNKPKGTGVKILEVHAVAPFSLNNAVPLKKTMKRATVENRKQNLKENIPIEKSKLTEKQKLNTDNSVPSFNPSSKKTKTTFLEEYPNYDIKENISNSNKPTYSANKISKTDSITSSSDAAKKIQSTYLEQNQVSANRENVQVEKPKQTVDKISKPDLITPHTKSIDDKIPKTGSKSASPDTPLKTMINLTQTQKDDKRENNKPKKTPEKISKTGIVFPTSNMTFKNTNLDLEENTNTTEKNKLIYKPIYRAGVKVKIETPQPTVEQKPVLKGSPSEMNSDNRKPPSSNKHSKEKSVTDLKETKLAVKSEVAKLNKIPTTREPDKTYSVTPAEIPADSPPHQVPNEILNKTQNANETNALKLSLKAETLKQAGLKAVNQTEYVEKEQNQNKTANISHLKSAEELTKPSNIKSRTEKDIALKKILDKKMKKLATYEKLSKRKSSELAANKLSTDSQQLAVNEQIRSEVPLKSSDIKPTEETFQKNTIKSMKEQKDSNEHSRSKPVTPATNENTTLEYSKRSVIPLNTESKNTISSKHKTSKDPTGENKICGIEEDKFIKIYDINQSTEKLKPTVKDINLNSDIQNQHAKLYPKLLVAKTEPKESIHKTLSYINEQYIRPGCQNPLLHSSTFMPIPTNNFIKNDLTTVYKRNLKPKHSQEHNKMYSNRGVKRIRWEYIEPEHSESKPVSISISKISQNPEVLSTENSENINTKISSKKKKLHPKDKQSVIDDSFNKIKASETVSKNITPDISTAVVKKSKHSVPPEVYDKEFSTSPKEIRKDNLEQQYITSNEILFSEGLREVIKDLYKVECQRDIVTKTFKEMQILLPKEVCNQDIYRQSMLSTVASSPLNPKSDKPQPGTSVQGGTKAPVSGQGGSAQGGSGQGGSGHGGSGGPLNPTTTDFDWEVENPHFTGLKYYFNSETMKGRANVAKATMLFLGMLSLFFYMKPGAVKDCPKCRKKDAAEGK